MTCNSRHTHGLRDVVIHSTVYSSYQQQHLNPRQNKFHLQHRRHARSISSHIHISQQSDIEQAQVQHQTEKFSHLGHVPTQDPNKGRTNLLCTRSTSGGKQRYVTQAARHPIKLTS